MTASAKASLTPVGDWLNRRYPPNPGATHWLGSNGDPGCCAGPHPPCTYDAGYREGARVEHARIIAVAHAMKATVPADHPAGAQASFASYLESLTEEQT